MRPRLVLTVRESPIAAASRLRYGSHPMSLSTDPSFEKAAELFAVLSSATRLRVIRSVCDGEKSVSEILQVVATTQPNLSQHLNMLYRAGVLGRRKDGAQVYYRVIDPRVTEICHSMCDHVLSR